MTKIMKKKNIIGNRLLIFLDGGVMIKEPMPFGLRIAIINRAFRKKRKLCSVFFVKKLCSKIFNRTKIQLLY